MWWRSVQYIEETKASYSLLLIAKHDSKDDESHSLWMEQKKNYIDNLDGDLVIAWFENVAFKTKLCLISYDRYLVDIGKEAL